MPTPTFQSPQGSQSLAQLQDYIVKLIRDLNYMLGNLDTLNVNRLDAKVIEAETITADKLNVEELSAITANMGTLTAGRIITDAEIDIGTDCRVGNNLIVGQSTTDDKTIYLNGAYIRSIFGADSIGMFGSGIVTLTSLDTIVLTCSLGNIGAISQHGTISDIVSSINSAQSTANSALSGLSGKANSFSGESAVLIFDGAPMGLGDVTLTFSNGILVNIAS